VQVFGFVDVTGFESASNGDYETGYNKAKANFIDRYNLTYPVLIEDESDTLSINLGVKGIVPSNVIINGVANDPNYDQWEVIYKGSGFPYNNPDAEMQYVEMYRSYIDKVTTTEDPILRIKTDQNNYFPGEELNANLRVKYFGQLPDMDVYSALAAFGQLYFYPNWTKNPEPTSLNLVYGYDETFDLLTGLSISTFIPEGTYTLLAISTETGTLNPISPLSQVDFNIYHQRSMKAYFKENPVYQDAETGKWSFTIYLESTWKYDIGMTEFKIETFDSEGLSLGVSDYISEFHKWFKLLGRILPAEAIAEASLTYTPNNKECEGLEIYFKGIDENDVEVEAKTERLELLTSQ